MRPLQPGCGWSRSGRLRAATAHRLLDTYDAVLDALCQAWNALTLERIRSLTGYPICNRPRFRRAGMTLHGRARRRIGPFARHGQGREPRYQAALTRGASACATGACLSRTQQWMPRMPSEAGRTAGDGRPVA